MFNEIDRNLEGTGAFMRFTGNPSMNMTFLVKNKVRYIAECKTQTGRPEAECDQNYNSIVTGAVEALTTDLEYTISHLVKCTTRSKDENACIKSAIEEGTRAFSRIDERLATA